MKTTKMVVIFVLALGLTAEVANADFTFGTATNLGPTVNSSAWDNGPSISADGLSLFFHSLRAGGFGVDDIWVTRRATKADPWGTPVNLGPTVNSSSLDVCPCISADGLALFFASERPGGYGGADIWVTTRPTTDEDWGAPVNLGPTVNSSAQEVGPNNSADGLELFFSGYTRGPYRPGGFGMSDLWVTTRKTKHDPWTEPVNLGPTVNSPAADHHPTISDDGLCLSFGSARPGGYGGPWGWGDLWVTTRATANEPWGEPVNLGPTVNSSADEICSDISPDGLMLFFGSERPGGAGSKDLWQVPIIPFVDFNGDEIVDIDDLVKLIEHWGQEEPSVDIGPTPFGDGIVDVQDLEVLMSYWGQEFEFLPFDLLAYWKLDETEGDIAYDSVAVNDAVVFGYAVWQPTAGQIDGALQFDGIDDYVSTYFVLNPADGPFSVFAWIKGRAPGQVVISQTDGAGMGATWLSADPTDGKLMTKLMPPAIGLRSPPQPMVSDFVITDGNWHRIGFVWNGSQRMLYVDDVEVAKDTQSGLETSEGGLYIGAGKTLDAASFFSGLIDDVRIYNRAVTP